MSDAAEFSVTIGTEALVLPKLVNFITLERLWPSLQALAASTDNVARASAALGIVSAVLITSRPELTVAELKKRLLIYDENGVDQRTQLFKVVDDLLIAAGLVRTPLPGEVAAPGSPVPGAETPQTSPTS